MCNFRIDIISEDLIGSVPLEAYFQEWAVARPSRRRVSLSWRSGATNKH